MRSLNSCIYGCDRTDYACISYVDHMIGWLVGEVKKQQLCLLHHDEIAVLVVPVVERYDSRCDFLCSYCAVQVRGYYHRVLDRYVQAFMV